MVRMLTADDTVKLFLSVALQRGLAAQVRNCDHPAEPGFCSILADRDQPIGPVEGAGHDLDAGAVDAAEAERCAAIATEIALSNRRGTERGRLAPRPGKIALFDLGKGSKRCA